MKKVSLKSRELIKESLRVEGSAHLCQMKQRVQGEKGLKETRHWGGETWVPLGPPSMSR